MIEKLGIGTVQFGQAYGVSNRHGQVQAEEIAKILARARDAGVRVLDTAANYGEAETVLAAQETSGFRIITKTVNLSHGVDGVLARARQSAKMLPHADTLLIHAAAELGTPDGARLWDALRAERPFPRIGISAYVADDPAGLAARFRPDVMQVPFSILDQRLLRDGSLAKMKGMGVEIHARSLFLQGLLLMENPPPHLAAIKPHLARLRTDLAKAGITSLVAALGVVLAQPEIDHAIVGVTSLAELEEILEAAQTPLPDLDWASYALKDERLLTPSLW